MQSDIQDSTYDSARQASAGRERGDAWRCPVVNVFALLLLLFLVGFSGCIPNPPAPNNNVHVWGRKGLDEGRFVKPRAIAIDAQDRIYIVDTTSRIQVSDRDGNYLRSWRTPKCVQGKPCGMSISNDGLLMVCDTHYFRVLFYTYEGELLEERTIGGTNGRGPGEFGFITDVAQDSKNNYYVAEYGDYDRIQKFSPEGEYITEWGGHGIEPGKFLRPQGLFMDKHDHLWIADASNNRIQVFDVNLEQPEVIKVWGTVGSAPGKLSYPYQVLVDEKDFVYVCELGNHRIQKFSQSGELVDGWGGAGRAPGQLHQPWAMAMDSQNSFHVLDSYNHRIQRFEFEEKISPASNSQVKLTSKTNRLQCDLDGR